jgi:hypothetical protein
MIINGTKVEKTQVEVEITNEELVQAIYRAINEKYPSIDLINRTLKDGVWYSRKPWGLEPREATHDELSIITAIFNLEELLIDNKE